MRDVLKILLLAFAMWLLLGGNCAHAKKTDVGLWLARSCVGEAGFDSGATSECAAMAHVYSKRAEINGLSYYRNVRLYSAAVKTCRQPWVCKLSRALKQPLKWAARYIWERYAPHWRNTLLMADAFIEGEVADPLPNAVHYGGSMDHWRAVKAGWKLIKTDGMKNNFYEVK
jgi:hypothetical protein